MFSVMSCFIRHSIQIRVSSTLIEGHSVESVDICVLYWPTMGIIAAAAELWRWHVRADTETYWGMCYASNATSNAARMISTQKANQKKKKQLMPRRIGGGQLISHWAYRGN